MTRPTVIIQGARAPKLCTPGAWSLGRQRDRSRGYAADAWPRCYAGAAAMPIHAAMPAMLQSPHSITARFRERRAEGQSAWGVILARR